MRSTHREMRCYAAVQAARYRAAGRAAMRSAHCEIRPGENVTLQYLSYDGRPAPAVRAVATAPLPTAKSLPRVGFDFLELWRAPVLGRLDIFSGQAGVHLRRANVRAGEFALPMLEYDPSRAIQSSRRRDVRKLSTTKSATSLPSR